MKLRITTLALLAVLLLAGCGGKSDDTKNAMKALEIAAKSGDAAKKTESYQKEFEKRRDERRQKGDTLAMDYKKLQMHLPASISGYQGEEPKGESVNMAGFAMSNASKTFRNGDNNVRIELIDYVQSYEAMAGASFWLNMNISVENDEGFSKVFNPGIPYTAGFEEYKKNNKTASVMYVLGGRFWLHIEANNQNNTDFVKSVAGQMNLKQLSEL